jgi:prepilin peptidase CpaA
MNAALGVLLAVTCVAAAIDVRTRRIPNLLTGGAACAVILVHAPNGIGAVTISLATMLVAFLAGSLAFSAGWFGGGDVKLIAAACGLVGAAAAMWLILDILLAGFVLVLISAAARGRLIAVIRSTAALAAHGAAADERHAVPYAVAIAAGSIVYTVSAVTPALRFPT